MTKHDQEKPFKQERYRNEMGIDWIDECEDSFTIEEFRGAMKFTIGKYNKRIGKKDEVIEEIRKMKDYCNRWEQYEERREMKNEK